MLRSAVTDAYFDTIMVGFNVANSTAAEFVIPKANAAGTGVIGMFAVRGLLSHADETTRIAREAGIGSLSELAYRYCRGQAGMDVVLTGTGDPAHLTQNIAAALAPPLARDVLERLRPLQTEGASTR
jgi:L-galactose dehydrogenase